MRLQSSNNHFRILETKSAPIGASKGHLFCHQTGSKSGETRRNFSLFKRDHSIQALERCLMKYRYRWLCVELVRVLCFQFLKHTRHHLRRLIRWWSWNSAVLRLVETCFWLATHFLFKRSLWGLLKNTLFPYRFTNRIGF